MNILHIVPYGVFMPTYINGYEIREGYNHIFFVYGPKANQKERDNFMIYAENVQYSESIDENIEEVYKISQIVVIQCIPENINNLKLLNRLNKAYKCKVIVVPWGRDLFKTSDVYRKLTSEEIFILDNLKQELLDTAYYIIGSKKVAQFLEKEYKIKGNVTWFNALNASDLNSDKAELINNSEINVMVGNRGTITSQHHDVFLKLMPIKKYINNIVCPLSYGNNDYMQTVDDYGEKLFKEKWHPIKNWIPKEQYLKYLYNNISVAIFNSEASEGGTTILNLLGAGKKVYINEKNYLYELYLEIGFIVFPWNDNVDINNVLVPMSEEDIEHNRNTIIDYRDKYDFNKNWYRIFKEVKEN